MDLFNFLKNKQNFVQISQIPNINKFFDIGNRLSGLVPNNPNDALYKDKNSKIISTKGNFDFAPLSEREHFVNKIFKNFPKCKMLLSIISNNNYKNHYIILLKIRASSSYYFGIEVMYYDLFNNKLKNITIYLHSNIAIKILNNKEKNILKKSLNILNESPKPIKEVIAISAKLYNKYEDYKKDCLKYDFYVYNKNIFDLFMYAYQTNYLLYNKTGTIEKIIDNLNDKSNVIYKIINK